MRAPAVEAAPRRNAGHCSRSRLRERDRSNRRADGFSYSAKARPHLDGAELPRPARFISGSSQCRGAQPGFFQCIEAGRILLGHRSRRRTGAYVFPIGSAQQHALLERLAYKAHQRETEKAGQQFFRLFRRYTVMGFYTTRIGLESLDYPGLKFYAASPGCTHTGNPEHLGL